MGTYDEEMGQSEERVITVRTDGGATIAEVNRQPGQSTSNLFPAGEKPSARYSFDDGGTTVIHSDGRVTRHGPQVSGGERRTDPENWMDTLTDNAGRGGIRWDDAIKNPSNYRVTVAGTQCSVETAIRVGWIRVQGNGVVTPNVREILKSAGLR